VWLLCPKLLSADECRCGGRGESCYCPVGCKPVRVSGTAGGAHARARGDVGVGKGGRTCRVEEKGEGVVEGRDEKALARSSEVLAARGQEGESAALESLLSEIWCTSYWAAIYSPTDLQENLTLTITLTLNPRHHSLYILLQLE
jgi:hypothetical protein